MYDQTWVTVYYADENLDECNTTSAMHPTDISVPWLNMFAISYHWAMATMSSLPYGDGPRAHTALEYVFGVACQVS